MKHSVVGLTETATIQYAGEGLRVNAVCPGWIDTELTADWKDDPDRKSFLYSRQSIKRPGEPEEVAALVRWMCSDEAAFVTGVAWANRRWDHSLSATCFWLATQRKSSTSSRAG